MKESLNPPSTSSLRWRKGRCIAIPIGKHLLFSHSKAVITREAQSSIFMVFWELPLLSISTMTFSFILNLRICKSELQSKALPEIFVNLPENSAAQHLLRFPQKVNESELILVLLSWSEMEPTIFNTNLQSHVLGDRRECATESL